MRMRRWVRPNKNAVPNDPRSPFITSGLRVGTPAITTRGFGEAETIELTGWMCDVLESLENGTSEQVIAEVKGKVLEICSRAGDLFPVSCLPLIFCPVGRSPCGLLRRFARGIFPCYICAALWAAASLGGLRFRFLPFLGRPVGPLRRFARGIFHCYIGAPCGACGALLLYRRVLVSVFDSGSVVRVLLYRPRSRYRVQG
jgi:hypothetical protein